MWRIWTALAVALLGNFQYDLGLDENTGGAVATAALFCGAGIGSLLAGPFGRSSGKYAQVWIGIMFASGSLLCGFTSENKICWGGPFDGCAAAMLVFGRFATGLASGFAIVVSPKYVAEISPSVIRGAIGSMAQLLVAIGAFLGLVSGLPLEYDVDFGYAWWRVMFLLSAVPAIVQASLAFLTFPLFEQDMADLRESLISSSKMFLMFRSVKSEDLEAINEESVNARPSKNESRESIPDPVDPSVSAPLLETSTSKWETFKTAFGLLLERRYRRCVVLGVFIPSVGMLSGVNLIDSYSTTIFEDAGLKRAIVGSSVYGFANVLGSLISVTLFDRLGRVTMAVLSFSGMTASLVAVALSSLLVKDISGPLSVLFLTTFILSFAAGCGALMIAYAPEVVPPELAVVVLGMGQSSSLFVALIQVLVFPSILDAVGVLASFLAVGGICAGCLIFLKIFMVETRGKELNDIMLEITGAPTL